MDLKCLQIGRYPFGEHKKKICKDLKTEVELDEQSKTKTYKMISKSEKLIILTIFLMNQQSKICSR